MTFAERSIPVDGACLRCVTGGEGPPAVVLHGGPGLGFDYLRRDLAPLLPGRRLVFYDQRGSGRSTGAGDPARLTVATFVADLESVLGALGIDRAELIGHSFGGLLALHFALAHPARARSLVLLDSDPASFEEWARFQEVVDRRRTEEDRREISAIEARPGWDRDPRAVEARLLVSLRPYFGDRALASRLAFGFDEGALANFPATSRHVREDLRAYDLRPRLHEIACPTLIVHGGASIFRREAAVEMHRLIAGSRLVILEGVGHFPQIEGWEQVAREIAHFG